MLRRILPALALAGLLAIGCAGRSVLEDPPSETSSPDASTNDDAGPPPEAQSDKLDLLLVVDNSRNLDLVHALLADTVPYVLDRLANPACVNGLGQVLGAPDPGGECVAGVLDFPPVKDIHIAVISTSLGGHGADLCSPASQTFTPSQNDAAHLLTRTENGGTVPTYAELGFLAWDPGQEQLPPGEASLPALSTKLADIVRGVGTGGCGFESQLESIYRFLVDPNPYQSISVVGGEAVPSGTDSVLLTQRAEFLRPDSVVSVVLLTDENDCSTREGGQFYLAGQGAQSDGQPFHLPRARSECAKDPNDPCCASCGQSAPSGCPPTEADPTCQLPPITPDDPGNEDPVNLRCFDQKRRFGIDFLYPTQRYVIGLTEPLVADRDGNVVKNPLFAGGRPAELVYLTGIVGVPWQDIAADPKALSLGFRPALQIDWSLFFGDPEAGARAFDPLMIESIDPREGENPVTGAALAPPTSSAPLANPINGHERLVSKKDDLQYACIFPRSTPKDCQAAPDCECVSGNIDTNPICQEQGGAYGTLQRYSRALPSIRPLAVLRDLGGQAAVASVCADVTSDTSLPVFGYKPAFDAMLRTIRQRLR